MDKNKRENQKAVDMGKTHWFLVAIGIIGGALLTSSVNALIFLERPLNIITAITVALIALSVIYYGRYG